jgi:flagellar biosynthesis/type III secretory pathway protein FliH
MGIDGHNGADGQAISAAMQDMSHDMLQQVPKQLHVSKSRIVQMATQIAQQMDKFSQVVVSAIQGVI